MGHKWGCQAPNKADTWNPDELVNIYGDGTYVLMQGELGHLARLRELAPDSLILLRMYLEDWASTDAEGWALHCATVYRQNKHLTRFLTWANEQNLRHESRGAIGAPGIEKWHYERIRDWNLTWIKAFREEPDCADALLVFPALAYGHSDDQADFPNDPYIGLEMLQPVIKLCDIGADHMYVQKGNAVDHRWNGLGRWQQRKPFLTTCKTGKVWINETGTFECGMPWVPEKIIQIGQFFDADSDVIGTSFFIHADPTRHHQDNDMSRDSRIYDAIKAAQKAERPSLDMQPTPAPLPIPIPPMPADTPKGMVVGYQVWQWNQVSTVGNLGHLLRDMNECGALVLTDKYMDSDAFMGQFDNDPLAVKSVQVMQDRRKWCEDNGKEYWPWDVPRAIPSVDTWVGALQGAIREAEVHAEVCNQAGLKKRLSDLEFYPSFFGYALEARGGHSFFQSHQARMDAAYAYYERFKALSDTVTILQPDPRQLGVPSNVGGIDAALLAKDGLIGEIIAQSYAYWFQQLGDTRTHVAIIDDAVQKVSSLGIPWGLCLYSEVGTPRDTPPQQAQDYMKQAIRAGCRYMFAYKAPVAPGLQFALKEVSTSTPLPIDEPGANQSPEVTALSHVTWSLGEQLEARAREARALGRGWAGNGMDGAALGAKTAAQMLLRGGRD